MRSKGKVEQKADLLGKQTACFLQVGFIKTVLFIKVQFSGE